MTLFRHPRHRHSGGGSSRGHCLAQVNIEPGGPGGGVETYHCSRLEHRDSWHLDETPIYGPSKPVSVVMPGQLSDGWRGSVVRDVEHEPYAWSLVERKWWRPS